MERFKGSIIQWNDEKGFGFVTTDTKSDKIFIHIKSFIKRNRRPELGDKVVYAIIRDEKNRPQATQIQFLHEFEREKLRQKKHDQTEGHKSLMAKVVAFPFILALVILFILHKINWLVLAFYGLINIWTYFAYYRDKQAAQKDKFRTPEKRLHLFSLLGGWIGALLAQRILRHKSQKTEFRQVFWFTVVIHIVIFSLLLANGTLASIEQGILNHL